MASSSSFLRQLSERREAWESTSNRWVENSSDHELGFGQCDERGLNNININNMYMNGCCGVNGEYNNNNNGVVVMRKRVMVVVDESSHSKHAMMWALTHVANKADLFTLLHIVPSSHRVSDRASSHSSSTSSSSSYSSSSSGSPFLANSLGSLCKACKPEVEVEALVIQGPKLATVINQVKKLEVSVLVLGQKKPSSLFSCFWGTSSSEQFVELCINTAECLTIGVRKQSRGVSGYLISTRWQKNFWLLA